VEEEGIDCDFARLDALWFLAGDLTAEEFEEEHLAMAAAGLSGVRRVEHIKGHTLSDGPCLVAPGQGRFHPLKYLDGLAAAVSRMGGRIFVDTCVSKVEELKTLARLETGRGHRVQARAVVLATNSPIQDDAKITHRENPVRTYAFAAEVPRGSV
jgi:glycine/D-amino acid oxidase-like deaminating enzyme